ncbi:MAG: PAS domain S-box protein [Anaerolineae bacterium]
MSESIPFTPAPDPNSATAWLLQVMSAANRGGRVDEIAAQSLEAIQSCLPFDAAFFLLIDPARARLIVQHPVHIDSELVAALEQMALPPDFFESAGRAAHEAFALAHLGDSARSLLAAQGYVTLYMLPLQAEHCCMGILALAGRDASLDFSALPFARKDYLDLIGGQLGLALQRARLTEQLRASEEEYRGWIDHNPDGVWERGLHGGTTLYNQAMLDMTGYTAAEVEAWDFFVPWVEPPAERRARWDKLLRDGHVQDERIPIRTKSGQDKIVNVTAWLRYDAAGQPTHLQMEFRDVTAHVRMEEQVQRRNQELLVLNRIGEELSSLLDLEKSIQGVLGHILSLTGMDSAAIFLSDAENHRVRLAAQRDLPQAVLDRYQARIASLPQSEEGWIPEHALRFFEHISRTRESIMLEDFASAEIARDSAMLESGLVSGVAAALRFGQQVLGVLTVGSRTPHAFTETESRLIEDIALRLALRLRNKELFDRMQARIRELQTLSDLSAMLGTLIDEAPLCDLVLRAIGEWMNLPLVSLNLLSGDHFLPPLRLSSGLARVDPLEMTPLVRRIIERPEPVILDSQHMPEMDAQAAHLIRMSNLEAVICLPLWTVNGPLGLLAVGRQDRLIWSPGEIQVLQTVANQFAVALSNARLFNTLIQERRDLQATLDSVFSGVFTTDEAGQILTWNRAAAEVTGYSLAQARGQNWTRMVRVGKDKPDELIFEAMAEKDIRFGFAPRTFRAADGREIPLAEAAAPLRDAEGRIRGAVGAFWDRTKEGAAEQARLEFLYEVSHELRNSLTAIIPMAEMLRQPDVKGATRKSAIDIITAQVERLKEFSKRFLAFEHAQVDKGNEQESLDLAAQVKEVLAPMRAEYPELRLRVTGQTGAVYADKPRLQTALLNLLDNACKFSPPHGRVSIRLERLDKDRARMTIRNQSPAIAPEAMGQLFERGYRAPQSGNGMVAGTGIGLWLARTKLREMGGEVCIENGEKEGVVACVMLRGAREKHEEPSKNIADRRQGGHRRARPAP